MWGERGKGRGWEKKEGRGEWRGEEEEEGRSVEGRRELVNVTGEALCLFGTWSPGAERWLTEWLNGLLAEWLSG